MPDVRRDRIDLPAVAVDRECEALPVRKPELVGEALLQRGGLLFETGRELRVVPELPREARAAHLGVVRVALDLAARARELRERSVAEDDRVPRVLPALVVEARLLHAPLVGHVAVVHAVAVVV